MDTIKVSITYDVTTPESAEHGEHADHGFYGPGGWKYSIADDDFQTHVARVGREQALKDMTPEPEEFDSVEEAIAYIERDGPFEASCGPPACGNGHCWLIQSSVNETLEYFEHGEDTRLSYHIDADPAIHAQIIDALR